MTKSLLQECEENRDDYTCLEAFAHADEEDLVRRGLSALPLIGQGCINGGELTWNGEEGDHVQCCCEDGREASLVGIKVGELFFDACFLLAMGFQLSYCRIRYGRFLSDRIDKGSAGIFIRSAS